MTQQGIINELQNELDLLKKALAMEKSVEKIRSKTLSINHSWQFEQIPLAIFKEFRALDLSIPVIHFYKKVDFTSKDLSFWEVKQNGSSPSIQEIHLPFQDDIWFNTIHDHHVHNKSTSFGLNNEETQFLENLKREIPEAATCKNLRVYLSFASKTGLMVIGNSAESINSEFTQRFVQLFEEAYFRYLELLNSELLIKKAEIEASLENVRVKGMAMKDTTELQDLVNEVSLHLKKNQIDINGGVFICINREVDKDVPLWGSGGAATYVQKAVVPYIDNPIFLNLRNAIVKKTAFIDEVISKKDKIAFFQHLFKHHPWDKAPLEAQERMLALPGPYARVATISNNTSIFMLNNVGKPFSDFDKQVLIRSGEVFEQLYTRFLDLQKAEEQNIKLQELEATKTRFYTNITHEFRTPLTVISGMANQIADNPKKWLDQGMSMIIRNSESLLVLVNQMLDLSKLESGNMLFNTIQADIAPYLKYLTESVHSLAEMKNITLIFNSADEKKMLDFDKDKIQQIMLNLLTNAIKFTPDGGKVNVAIKLKAEQKPLLHISVEDSGIGISNKHIPHIFNRFYQVDDTSTRQIGGSGIGLALVNELVQLTGGSIRVESEINKGTKFSIELPVTNKAPLDDFKEIEPKPKLIKQGIWPKEMNLKTNKGLPQILLIEDSPDMVTYIVSCLEKDFEIRLAKNGQEGVNMAMEFIPDLIISDVMMPFKDGYEVCHNLKNEIKTSHIPIILLTAKADLESRLEGFEKGADAYLAKPFHSEELIMRISKLLESRKKLQAFYLSQIGNSAQLVNEQNPENEFILKIQGIIEDNLLHQEFNVESLCVIIGISHSQLHRKLMALVGISPNKLINQIKLQNAKKLLENSTLNISQIATNSGFNDPGYFSRIFKKEFGKTPQSWRS
ncbi:Signal transduction histidine kinase [Spirosomataceae bacterium TFI 002]|nr:Signal transduction histidine kinase [Spirosomataceae bacterium TFI 002]